MWARRLIALAFALAACWITTDAASAAEPFAASGTWFPTAFCHVRVDSLLGLCEGGETFTGTVAGRSGTARFHNVIFIDAATGASRGTFSIIAGTSGLANLRGHADTAGTPGGGTYTGQFHFGSS